MTAENEVLTSWIVFCHCCGIAYLQMGRINFLYVSIKAPFLLVMPSSMLNWSLHFSLLLWLQQQLRKNLVMLSLLLHHTFHSISVTSIFSGVRLFVKTIFEYSLHVLPGVLVPWVTPLAVLRSQYKKRENFRSSLRNKRRTYNSF